MSQAVDVIIPTYNGMPWLSATLDSVLRQTHKNITVYIIDDGSTDGTETFAKKIKDKRVSYIKKTNGGVSSARNYGIKNSSSPFIAFLDSDDIWFPEKLEKQIELMDNPDVGLVYGHHYLIDEDDVILSNLRIYKRGNIFTDLCDGNCIAGSASMALIRREAVDKLGVFDESLVNGEDWEYWLRIANEYEVDFVPEIIASIRVHANNAQGNTRKMADGLQKTLDVILQKYDLSKNQRVRVASYCLNNAINTYFALKDYPAARHATLRLIKENPHSLIDGSTWRINLGFSLILRGLLTNKYLVAFNRLVGSAFRFPFWLLRRVKILVKRSIRKVVH